MAGPEVAVLIPYGYRSHWEEDLANHVAHFWNSHFPQWPVIFGASEEPFNRSAARNHAARQCPESVKAFVICDSDTRPSDFFSVETAVGSLLESTGAAWYGCGMYYMLSKARTAELVFHEKTKSSAPPWEKSIPHPPGGITICRRSDFGAVGGYDEEFRGWGYEDSAFHAALSAIVGPRQAFGDVLHLWHLKDRTTRQGQPNIAYNKRRYGLYEEASRGGPGAMRKLLVELRGVTET